MRSESCSFIWHPKVRIQYLLPMLILRSEGPILPGHQEARGRCPALCGQSPCRTIMPMAEILAIVLALSPVGLALLVALRLIARRRARWRAAPDLRRRPGSGGEPGSVREPRRPLVPAGAATAALPVAAGAP